MCEGTEAGGDSEPDHSVRVGNIIVHRWNQSATADKTREVVDESFFSYVWNSHVLRRQIEGAARTTAGIYKINQGHILDFIIPLCSPGEQAVVASQLSETLSAIDEFEAEVDEQVSKLGALRCASPLTSWWS